jgi:2-polyprenyl-3-methyl-5-hydroxy-6-metoxy-1,4-benzoquinol methylase
MSRLGATFFTWVQGACFYSAVHAEAVDLLSPGEGKTWLDVGCGPGLVARLAAARGYDARGVDRDRHMVDAARRNAGRTGARYDVADLDSATRTTQVDVVSAASLLVVLPDAREGLAQLWRAVRPGGYLLVVETTSAMTPAAARRIAPQLPDGRKLALRLWAKARSRRAVDATLIETLPGTETRRVVSLMHGLVGAWVIRRVEAS